MGVGRSARFASFLVAIGLVVCAAPTVAGRTGYSSPPAGRVDTLSANHPILLASLSRIYAGSVTWREALRAVADTGRRIVVVTPDMVRLRDAAGTKERPFDDDVLAEVYPVADHWSRVETVIVVVNLPLMDTLYSDATRFDLERDLDGIVAHEIYGHAVPYLLAGHLSGKCADPAPRQRAAESCAIKRENEIRRELRLGERRSSGLDALTLARRYR
jgi:hypothetical protein